jgi:hypothetical protein
MRTLTRKKRPAATVRRLDSSVMQEICLLLNLSEEAYFQHQYKVYEEFITLACHADQYRNYIRYSPLFSRFWINEWAMRNKRRFVPVLENQDYLSPQDAAADYYYLHDAEVLASDAGLISRYQEIAGIILRMETGLC